MTKIAQQCKGGMLHLIKIPREYRIQVAKTVEKVLAEAGRLFQYQGSIEIIVFSSVPETVIPELGITARALPFGNITVYIDFSRKDVKNIIQKELPSTMYHEFSHVVRENVLKNSYGTLLEELIREGIASYTEKHIFKKSRPYIKPIQAENRFWKKAKKILLKKSFLWDDFERWFLGKRKLPRWIGFRLGYLRVEEYMKNNPKTSFAQLVRLRSKTILQGSGL